MGRWESSLTFLPCIYLILWNAIDFWRGLLLPSLDGLGICEVDSRLRNKRIHLVRKKKKDKIKEMWESTSRFFCWCLLLFLFCGNSSWFNVLLTFEIRPGEQGLWTFAWEFPFSIDFSTAVVWLNVTNKLQSMTTPPLLLVSLLNEAIKIISDSEGNGSLVSGSGRVLVRHWSSTISTCPLLGL